MYTTDSLHIIFGNDTVTAFVTPAHWIHPSNLEDSVYVPEKIQHYYRFSRDGLSVYGDFVYEKEE
ncbi:MAG: hypothetical protein H8E51_08875 [Bacteroidetes bacterium]|nr:hypothetical protein [Bacteroidota bacterium]